MDIVYKDKNRTPFEKGSVFDINQTVNGCNTFIVMCLDPLDVRYFYDGKPQRRYEYSITELMHISMPFSNENEVEIISKFDLSNFVEEKDPEGVEPSPVYPKGFVRGFDRNACEDCKFFGNNKGSVPPQEVRRICKKVTPNVEVMLDDVCDEYQDKN